LLTAVSAFALLLVQPVVHTQGVSEEYRLKAAFVYRFPQFIEWPASALANTPSIDLCVLRPNPFGDDLRALVQGETLGGRPLRVRDITASDDVAGCHLVFAPRSQTSEALLKATAGRPILTIGETDRFLDAGGIIALKVVDRRVRFDVSATNAQKAGLRIDARLLSLAASVRGGPS
jgi:hypothetical protein